jgi:arylsulfatase A-like enzyme
MSSFCHLDADEGKKPLDGMNVWPTLSQGKPSPRTEVVCNVEPSTAGVREGNWKLVWRAQLPASLGLFDLANDPHEKHNLAAENPEKLRELQKRANDLAGTMAPPLFIKNGTAEVMELPPAFPSLRQDAPSRPKQQP